MRNSSRNILSDAVNNGTTRNTRKRRVVVSAPPASLTMPAPDGFTVKHGSIILPCGDDVRAFGNRVFAPTEAEIAQFGDAESAAYHNAHDDDELASELAEIEREALASEPASVAANSEPAKPAELTDIAKARRAAAKAVAAFYSGVSLPFKSAYDLPRKAPVRHDGSLNRSPTARTAALLAAILTYCDVQPGSLTFVRASGRVPGRLLGLTGDDANRTFSAGPESGCLGNLIPDRVAYVSGADSGKACGDAVYRINYDAALANLRAHNSKQSDGEHLFSGAIALLELLASQPAPDAA